MGQPKVIVLEMQGRWRARWWWWTTGRRLRRTQCWPTPQEFDADIECMRRHLAE